MAHSEKHEWDNFVNRYRGKSALPTPMPTLPIQTETDAPYGPLTTPIVYEDGHEYPFPAKLSPEQEGSVAPYLEQFQLGVPSTQPQGGWSPAPQLAEQELFPGALAEDPDRLGLIMGESEEDRNFRLESERVTRGMSYNFRSGPNATLKEFNDLLQEMLRTTPPWPVTGIGGLFGRALEVWQEEVEMNVALARSVIPTTAFGRTVPTELGGTKDSAAKLRAEGLNTYEAALQAAEDDPLVGSVPLNLLNLVPGGPLIASVEDALIRFGVAPDELVDIQEATTIGIPTQMLAEMALDWLNVLAVLGPAVKVTRVGVEFFEAVAKSGLRHAGETLEQFALRMAMPLTGMGGAPLGPWGKLPMGREPSDIRRAIQDAHKLQSATPPPGTAVTPSSTMPQDKADEIIEWFSDFIRSPESIEAHALTEHMRMTARAIRIENFNRVYQEGIDIGLGPQEAYGFAIKELGGPLPSVDTGVAALATEEVKTALVSKVLRDLANEPWEKISTMEALKIAFEKGTISRKLGTGTAAFPDGGSAYLRLQRIFPQKIVDALDGTNIDDLIAINMAKAPQTLTRIDIPPSRPYGQVRLGEEPFELGKDLPDPRTAEQKELAMIRLRRAAAGEEVGPPTGDPPPVTGPLGGAQQARMFDEPFELRQLPVDSKTSAEKSIELQIFETLLSGQADDATRKIIHEVGATVDGVVVKHVELMPNPDRQLVVKTLRLAGLNAMDIGNFIRSNMASADVSWLRQQAMLLFGNPNEFGPALADSLRSIWSAEFADEVMDAIYKTELYQKFYRQIDADFLRPLSGEVGKLYEAAEDFMILSTVKGQTKLRPFQALAQKLPWIRISARAHVIGTNSMNWRIFEKHYENMLKIQDDIATGRRPMPKGEKTHNVEREMRLFSRMLADMSGRASLGPLKSISPGLNAGIFSARLTLSRFVVFRHLWSPSKHVRKQAWKNMATFFGGFSSILLAGRQMGLWDLETDRSSADFMKILLNNGRTRIDVWGGFQQVAVLFGRILRETPQIKSTTTGEVSEADPAEIAFRFSMSKIHPSLSNALELWLEEDYTGSDIDRKDWMRWLSRNAPMAGVDIYEAFDAEGLVGITFGSTAIIGAGVQTYDLPRWRELDTYYSFSKDHPSASPGAVRMFKANFRKDPNNEAKLFVRGHITTLSSASAGIIVQKLMRDLKLTPKDVPGYEKTFGGTQWPPGSGKTDALTPSSLSVPTSTPIPELSSPSLAPRRVSTVTP